MSWQKRRSVLLLKQSLAMRQREQEIAWVEPGETAVAVLVDVIVGCQSLQWNRTSM
jgi:hypothetical protein